MIAPSPMQLIWGQIIDKSIFLPYRPYIRIFYTAAKHRLSAKTYWHVGCWQKPAWPLTCWTHVAALCRGAYYQLAQLYVQLFGLCLQKPPRH